MSLTIPQQIVTLARKRIAQGRPAGAIVGELNRMVDTGNEGLSTFEAMTRQSGAQIGPSAAPHVESVTRQLTEMKNAITAFGLAPKETHDQIEAACVALEAAIGAIT